MGTTANLSDAQIAIPSPVRLKYYEIIEKGTIIRVPNVNTTFAPNKEAIIIERPLTIIPAPLLRRKN